MGNSEAEIGKKFKAMAIGLSEAGKRRWAAVEARSIGRGGVSMVSRATGMSRLTIDVCHFPPGTSKWNKIEHRMFCHITRNWRGRPLESTEVIVKLIGATTTAAGLKIKAALDKRKYDKGITVTTSQMAEINLKPDKFQSDWNYAIIPNS